MSESASNTLAALLTTHRGRVLAYVQKHAGAPLLRFETAEDLVQGIHHTALRQADRFDSARSEDEHLGWVFQIARRHLSDRRDHWFAMKRFRGGLLRITLGGSITDGLPPLDPADTRTGPATFANRREQLAVLAKAIDLLPARDQDLVRWASESVPLAEQSSRLGLTPDAISHARARALERLQKTYKMVWRREMGDGPA